MNRIPIRVTVNGDPRVADVEPGLFLIDLLRDHFGLTGTNRGCDQGDCGACTVLVDGRSVNSCIMLAVEADGTEITTIEGLPDKGTLHPVQKAFIDEGAIQCGYCTPGMVMQAVAYLLGNPAPTPEEARWAIEGNLCRCTGYERIVKAIRKAAERMKGP